jgi:myosin heavy subunit
VVLRSKYKQSQQEVAELKKGVDVANKELDETKKNMVAIQAENKLAVEHLARFEKDLVEVTANFDTMIKTANKANQEKTKELNDAVRKLDGTKRTLAETRRDLAQANQGKTNAEEATRQANERYNAMMALGRVGLDVLKQDGQYISQPTRFTALDLGPAGGWDTNGEDHFELRAVTKNMYENIAYSVVQMQHAGIAATIGEVKRILKFSTGNEDLKVKGSFTSPVSIKIAIYSAIKDVLNLQHSTYASVQQVYEISSRFNHIIDTLFADRARGFRLIQPSDIRLLMRHNPNAAPALPVPQAHVQWRQQRIQGFLANNQ